MSGLLNSTSNIPDSPGRTFSASFSSQSGAAPLFHHPGAIGLRNTTMNNIPSGGAQQAAGNLSNGRFASNNLPVALSQIAHNNVHGHSGIGNRSGLNVVGNQGYSNSGNNIGGSIPGILPTSASTGNRMTVPGFGMSPVLGNAGPRLTNSMGNISSGGSIGRTLSSGGGLSVPALASRLNLNSNSGSGNMNVHGQNRLMSGMLQQASPQVLSMLGNSYTSVGGSLSQNHVQAVNSLSSMGILNDVNSNDGAPFDINDFPQLSSRPSSSGGSQGQLGSLRKQGLNPIVQQNQEFSIETEDFPALPGFKGGNGDYSMDLHQKDQLHESSVSMMQPQQFTMGRSSGFDLGAIYSSLRPQQQQQLHAQSATSNGGPFSNINNQDLVHLHGSEIFPSAHSSFHAQSSGPPGIGLRPVNSPSSASATGSYDQLLQQYQQQQQNSSHFRLQQMSPVGQPYRDQGMKPLQSMQATYDPFGLLGLLSVIRMSDPDLTSLALGIDLTTLGLNLNASENLYRTFASPWSDEPSKGDPEFTVPQCYYAKQPPPLQAYFSKFPLDTLFYIFYSMPKDEAQLYSANELYNRGWLYHKEHRFWFTRVSNMEPLVKTSSYERGSYICFDPNTWETLRKDNFVLHYDMLEKRPVLSQH